MSTAWCRARFAVRLPIIPYFHNHLVLTCRGDMPRPATESVSRCNLTLPLTMLFMPNAVAVRHKSLKNSDSLLDNAITASVVDAMIMFYP